MGGCATKPKTGEEELAPAPVPAPEPVKEDTEAKEVAVVGEEEKLAGQDEGAEIQVEERVIDKAEVADDAVKPDDTTDKPRSLGNLFKEGEEEKESSVKDETIQKEPNTDEAITKEAKAEEPATTPAAEVESAVPVASAAEEKSTLPVAPAAEEKSTLPVAPAAEEKSTLPVAPAAETIEEEKTIIAATTNIQQEKTETEEEKRTEEEKGIVAKDVQVTEA